MGPVSLREKIKSGFIDPLRKEQVLNELKYFNSIAPKSWRESFKVNKEKIREFSEKYVVFIIIGFFLLLPCIFALMAFALNIGIILLLVWVFVGRNRGTPEYKAYDFRERVVRPALRLLDDRLDLNFHYNKYDLVDEDIYYDDALVEARLVRPINKKAHAYTYSSVSYNWDDIYDTDAFEMLGYKLYYEYKDSDGDTHEDIFFDGLIFKFRTSFTINGTVNIMSTQTKNTLIGEREKNRFKKIKDKDINVIDTENSEFADNFDTIATYDNEAYEYLTPSRIESLLKLRKDHYICICIKKNVMTVSIYGGFKDVGKYAFAATKPYSRSLDSEAELDKMLRQYTKAVSSIYELRDILV